MMNKELCSTNHPTSSYSSNCGNCQSMNNKNIFELFDEKVLPLIIRYGQNTRLGTNKLANQITNHFRQDYEAMVKELEGIKHTHYTCRDGCETNQALEVAIQIIKSRLKYYEK